ncbi:MAG: NFACT RNA binding domain-containing protein [Polyangiaceae bacterium]
MASKGRPYRTFEFQGFSILVGRGDAENDELSFRVAKQRDIWLHVGGGTPGSHVVIQRPESGEEPPRDVLEYAAKLAAWFSKARNAKRVEVHYCPASHVKKPRGAPRGLVQLSSFKSIRVAPELPESESPELD